MSKPLDFFCLNKSRGLPVLSMVAGLLRGQRAGQPGHLDPDCVIQVLFTGVDRAGNYEWHPKQAGAVLLS